MLATPTHDRKREGSPVELRNWLIVVPARLASERLPRKPLQDLGGLPLVVRVAKNLGPLRDLGAELVVATDASEVMDALKTHGVPGVMTRVDHESGTDRCAEAARASQRPFILNVQGDEPFVDAGDLRALARAVETRADAAMGTLVYESRDQELAGDPNAVKAVRAGDGYALYFSRATIPYDRGAKERGHRPESFWHHLGVYAFRRDKLEAFVKLPPSKLERTEKLEQLRAVEAGWKIYLHPARTMSRGIDTPEDLAAARKKL